MVNITKEVIITYTSSARKEYRKNQLSTQKAYKRVKNRQS